MAKFIPLEKIREKYLTPTSCHALVQGLRQRSLGNAFLQAYDRLGLDPDKTVLISGIGCNGYLTATSRWTISTPCTAGRRRGHRLEDGRPDLKIITIQGDGDAAAIGGNHLIHVARRNIGSPRSSTTTSPTGGPGGSTGRLPSKAPIRPPRPGGLEEPPFDLCKLMTAAGAISSPRTSYGLFSLADLMEKALAHKGSPLSKSSPCAPPITAENPARERPGPAMLRWQKKTPFPSKKQRRCPKRNERKNRHGISSTATDPNTTSNMTLYARGLKRSGHETRS